MDAQRHLSPVPPPPGHMRVQRAADDPRPRLGKPADLPPRRPGLREGLCHQVLGELPVAYADDDDPQAVIPGRRVEVRELALVLFHALYTHERPDSFTSRGLDFCGRGLVATGPASTGLLSTVRRWEGAQAVSEGEGLL